MNEQNNMYIYNPKMEIWKNIQAAKYIIMNATNITNIKNTIDALLSTFIELLNENSPEGKELKKRYKEIQQKYIEQYRKLETLKEKAGYLERDQIDEMLRRLAIDELLDKVLSCELIYMKYKLYENKEQI